MLELKDKRILVTGGAGFLGKQVVNQLIQAGANPDKITIPRSRDCDLRRLESCQQAVSGQDVVVHLAAHVGGIGLNREKPAELFYDNLMMGTQLIHTAYEAKKDLEYINEQLFLYLYIVGLNPKNVEDYSIDEIINSARNISIAPINEVESGSMDLSNDPLYLFLKNQRISLIANIRRIWYMRQLAIGAIRNAV